MNNEPPRQFLVLDIWKNKIIMSTLMCMSYVLTEHCILMEREKREKKSLSLVSRRGNILLVANILEKLIIWL